MSCFCCSHLRVSAYDNSGQYFWHRVPQQLLWNHAPLPWTGSSCRVTSCRSVQYSIEYFWWVVLKILQGLNT